MFAFPTLFSIHLQVLLESHLLDKIKIDLLIVFLFITFGGSYVSPGFEWMFVVF